jgi:formate dehydrogenase major subunit
VEAAMADPRQSGFLRHWLERWPAFQEWRQWRAGKPFDQLGLDETPISDWTRGLEPRTRTADAVVPSICPYCAVGCGQLVYVRDGKIIDIEGNPHSPVNAGTLCPKGAATFGLLVNPARVTTVRYRAPYADHWEDRPLDWAMERIAQRVKQTRDAGYQVTEPETGKALHRCFNIASLGGATLDNEENYLIKKLLSAGLGMVWIENQARV